MYQQHKFNFFEQITYAVARPRQYYRLTKVSGARLTGFVFLFTFIVSLFTIIPMFNSMVGPNGFSHYLRNDLPEFDLSNGELYVNMVYHEVTDGALIYVDTGRISFSSEDIDNSYHQVILISKTNLITKSNGRLQEIDFADLGGLHIDNSIVNALIPFLYFILFFAAIIVYIAITGYYFLSALFYSLIGLIVSSVRNANLTFATIFKTAVYSKVTISILFALIEVTPLALPGLFKNTVAFVVTSIYVIYGVLSHTSQEAYQEAGIQIPPSSF